MALSEETKAMIREQIELLKIEKQAIKKEIDVLSSRRDELGQKKEGVQNKIDKFQADLNA